MNVHNVSLRAFIQATEGEDRVRTALSLFLFDGKIKVINTEGHFGNPITSLQAHIKGRDCKRFIELLKSKLPGHELERLKEELDERIDDERCLHVRFDKQAAYNGIVQLAKTSDTIAAEIKLKAFPARRENAIAAAEEIF